MGGEEHWSSLIRKLTGEFQVQQENLSQNMNAESSWDQLANVYHQLPQANVYNLHKEQLGSTVGLSGRAHA